MSQQIDNGRIPTFLEKYLILLLIKEQRLAIATHQLDITMIRDDGDILTVAVSSYKELHIDGLDMKFTETKDQVLVFDSAQIFGVVPPSE